MKYFSSNDLFKSDGIYSLKYTSKGPEWVNTRDIKEVLSYLKNDLECQSYNLLSLEGLEVSKRVTALIKKKTTGDIKSLKKAISKLERV